MSRSDQTFWTLAGDWIIEIPIIQRDYAQGRLDSRSKQVREDFLAAIISAVRSPADKTLDLDLVYGSNSGGKLVLLDGQQRITTLFLLHWYLAKRGADVWEGVKSRFLRFTYETRVSSREFCNALANADLQISNEQELSEQITDASWFYLSWKKDPTIQSMLTMLDAIHEALKEDDHTRLWNHLVDESVPPLTFRFLEIKAMGLTDDLYIKMNARGRPLTDFENFKAWIELQADRRDFQFPALDWKTQLDGEWMDLFWNCTSSIREVDIAFLQFFKGVALNSFLARSAGSDPELPIEKFRNDEYIPTSLFEEFDLFNQQSLEEIFSVLEKLKGSGLAEIEKALRNIEFDPVPSVFRRFIAQKVTYPDRVLFYALCQWLLRSEGTPSHAFARWMRVVRNLVENSNIDGENFHRAICSVQELASNGIQNILGYLCDSDPKSPGFSGYQMEEEKLKAGLILEDAAWEAPLVDAENHSYFRGQVRFLIDFSRGNDGKCDNAKFQEYVSKAKRIFNEEGGLITHPEFLVQRALLHHHDYLLHISGSTYSFGGYRYDWVRLFQDEEKAKALQLLLDEIDPGTEEHDLQDIIKKSDVSDWRSHFIRNHETIDFCGEQRLIQFMEDGDHILLMSGSTKRGWHVELRSFCCHVVQWNEHREALAPFAVDYSYSKSYNLPYAVLKHGECRLEIQHPRHSPADRPYVINVIWKGGDKLPDGIADGLGLGIASKSTENGTGNGEVFYSKRYGCEKTTLEGAAQIVEALRPFLN